MVPSRQHSISFNLQPKEKRYSLSFEKVAISFTLDLNIYDGLSSQLNNLLIYYLLSLSLSREKARTSKSI
jgi:hypothetical protein